MADGLTYAVGPDGLTLVAVDAAAAPDGSISVPASVAYDGITYDVTAVGPYAFYLSGATDVALPASIASVDERAFRSSDVGRVEVDPGNPNCASFDGCLYDSQLTRLLLIPGGRQGAVRIADKAEEVEASAFSHCAGVNAISGDAGSATFASWDGLLYDASSETLLRVPAGASEITIRDGCTAVAAGALEGCANLERINAPATVTSISPDVFTSIPTVSLPATAVAGSFSEVAVAPQLTAMVVLNAGDIAPAPDPSCIEVRAAPGTSAEAFAARGFKVTENEDSASDGLSATISDSATYAAGSYLAVTGPRSGGCLAICYENGNWTGGCWYLGEGYLSNESGLHAQAAALIWPDGQFLESASTTAHLDSLNCDRAICSSQWENIEGILAKTGYSISAIKSPSGRGMITKEQFLSGTFSLSFAGGTRSAGGDNYDDTPPSIVNGNPNFSIRVLPVYEPNSYTVEYYNREGTAKLSSVTFRKPGFVHGVGKAGFPAPFSFQGANTSRPQRGHFSFSGILLLGRRRFLSLRRQSAPAARVIVRPL